MSVKPGSTVRLVSFGFEKNSWDVECLVVVVTSLQHPDVMDVDEWVWIVYELSPRLCYLLKKFGCKSMHTMNDKWVGENGFSDFLNDTCALD